MEKCADCLYFMTASPLCQADKESLNGHAISCGNFKNKEDAVQSSPALDLVEAHWCEYTKPRMLLDLGLGGRTEITVTVGELVDYMADFHTRVGVHFYNHGVEDAKKGDIVKLSGVLPGQLNVEEVLHEDQYSSIISKIDDLMSAIKEIDVGCLCRSSLDELEEQK